MPRPDSSATDAAQRRRSNWTDRSSSQNYRKPVAYTSPPFRISVIYFQPVLKFLASMAIKTVAKFHVNWRYERSRLDLWSDCMTDLDPYVFIWKSINFHAFWLAPMNWLMTRGQRRRPISGQVLTGTILVNQLNYQIRLNCYIWTASAEHNVEYRTRRTDYRIYSNAAVLAFETSLNIYDRISKKELIELNL